MVPKEPSAGLESVTVVPPAAGMGAPEVTAERVKVADLPEGQVWPSATDFFTLRISEIDAGCPLEFVIVPPSATGEVVLGV